MNRLTHAYETLHALHPKASKPINQCPRCVALMVKEDEYNEAQVNQAIENTYHSHGIRR